MMGGANMALDISEKVESLVQKHLTTGRYRSVEHVLVTALTRLDEQDLIANLYETMADEAAGRVKSFAEVDAVLRERFGLPKA